MKTRFISLFSVPVILLTIALAFVQICAAQPGDTQTTPETPDCQRLMMAMSHENMNMDANAAAPRVRVVEPAGGQTIYGSQVMVTIETENFDLGAGKHWHLWVNGELKAMVYEAQTALDLEPGTYELCAILGDDEHMDVGIPGGVTVTVAQAQVGTPTAVPQPTPAGTVAEETRQPASPLQIVVIVIAFLLAGGLGWIVGKWLPEKMNRRINKNSR